MPKANEPTITRRMSLHLTRIQTSLGLVKQGHLTERQRQQLLDDADKEIDLAHEALLDLLTLIRRL